jgi:hypothetical protein
MLMYDFHHVTVEEMMIVIGNWAKEAFQIPDSSFGSEMNTREEAGVGGGE